jgi:hypothetical protein
MKPALWDELTVAYAPLDMAYDLTPDGAIARMRARCSFFEAQNSAQLGMQSANVWAREWEARLTNWHVLSHRIRYDEDLHRALYAMGTIGPYASMALAVWIPVLFGWTFVRRSLGCGRTMRLRHAHERGRCPGCAYELAMLCRAADGAGRTVCSLCGPRVCPECGAGWPRVPPPVLGGRSQ